ncbi:MAG: hypothetical protein ACK5LK_01660 [Chthoniobacterales bacterium]
MSLVAAGRAAIIVGSGADSSYLVLEASAWSASPLVYEWRYDYDSLNPPDGYDILSAVIAFDSNLTGVFNNYGTPEDPSYFLASLSYDGVNLVNAAAPPWTPYWSQWVSGGEAGYPVASPLADGTWAFGSGLSDPYRLLAPGSWDGFVFGDGLTAPSISPIPEPSAIYFLGGAVVLLYFRRRFLQC